MKNDMYREWIENIPCQFRKKKNIDALIAAFSRQLDEIFKVCCDLKELTDLETAVGKNLDMIGTIVNMSRKDAYILLNKDIAAEMDDETYRNVLRFQILKNNSDAIYADIMKGLSLLWTEKANIHYAEARREPACIELTIDGISVEDTDPAVIKPMVIRAGGVKILFRVSYLDSIDITTWEKFKNCRWFHQKGRRWNGAFNFDGTIEFHPEWLMYHYYDGKNRFDGSITWSSYVGREDTELGEAILLNQAKEKMLKMRHDGSNGWKIEGIALGDGLGDDGRPYTPDPEQKGLRHEVLRKGFESASKISDTCYRYEGNLLENEGNGTYFTEMGLYDSDGMLICVKTFEKKLKNKDIEMVFQIDDTYEEK